MSKCIRQDTCPAYDMGYCAQCPIKRKRKQIPKEQTTLEMIK